MLKCFQSVRNTFSRRDVPVDEEYELQGKDVITLVIEGNNPECILTAFERLTPEDFNRRRDVRSGYTPLHEAVRLKSSNAVKALLESEHVNVELLDERSYKARKYIGDKETAKLFIKYYNNKTSNLKGKIADSDKRLTLCEHISRASRYFFVSLIALSSGVFIYNQLTKDTSNLDGIIRYIVLITGCSGLIALAGCLADVVSFYCCKKENSRLKEELNSCERGKYESECKLFNLRKEEAFSYTGANLVPPREFQVTSVSGSVYSPEGPNIHIP